MFLAVSHEIFIFRNEKVPFSKEINILDYKIVYDTSEDTSV